MFLNMHADLLYAMLWGDKDTYRIAFTLARSASRFHQAKFISKSIRIEFTPSSDKPAGAMIKSRLACMPG